MRLWLSGFGGMVPQRKAHLLPDSGAQDARNVDLDSGSLLPRKTNSTVNTPTKVGTKRAIYRFGKDLDSDAQYWFHWLNRTSVTRGPIADDPSERTFYAERGQPPKVTDSSIALTGGTDYPMVSYLLGLPQPAACAISVTGTPTPGTTVAVSLQVTYTYVSVFGEEGPPALAPSNAADWLPGQELNVTGMAVAPAGNYNVVSKRIYVEITDTSGVSVFKFWVTVPVGQTAYTAILVLDNLVGEIEQPILLAPRTDLFGLMAHPNGFLIGFSGKRACRSELNRPHGWPGVYEDPVATDILGGAIVNETTLICAKGQTYLAHAVDPIDWSIVKKAFPPCVSEASIAAGDGAFFYAAQDGIVTIDESGSGALITTKLKLITRKQWAAYKPETMLGFYWDEKYIVFYDNGVTQGSLLFDFEAPNLTKLDLFATAGYVDDRRNELYLQVGSGIVKFEGGAGSMTSVWRSREWRTVDTAMIAGRVVAASYPVTMRVYGDGLLRHTQTVNDDEIFPMVSAPDARLWFWEIESFFEVTAAGVADNPDDLIDEAIAAT